jgi:hypothetical protein
MRLLLPRGLFFPSAMATCGTKCFAGKTVELLLDECLLGSRTTQIPIAHIADRKILQRSRHSQEPLQAGTMIAVPGSVIREPGD